MQLPAGQQIIQRASAYSINVGAFEQLTAAYLVEQGSTIACRTAERSSISRMQGMFPRSGSSPRCLLPAEIIQRSGRGDVRNDGLVPVESATFRYDPIESEDEQVLPADHAAQIGHGCPGPQARPAAGAHGQIDRRSANACVPRRKRSARARWRVSVTLRRWRPER